MTEEPIPPTHHPPQLRPLGSHASGSKSTSPLSTPRQAPKLGDFSKLLSEVQHASSESVNSAARADRLKSISPSILGLSPAFNGSLRGGSASPSQDGSAKLGDFSKLAQLFILETHSLADLTPSRKSKLRGTESSSESKSSLADSVLFEDILVTETIPTPATTPPTPIEETPSRRSTRKKAKTSASLKPDRLPEIQELFAYQFVKYGPLTPIYGHHRSQTQKFDSLSTSITSLVALDASLSLRYPTVSANGIHVFLDMSNINISFHNALRAKYNIPERTRLVPLPNLNLNFLTKILVRNRDTKILNVGCSVHPNRSEPHYVQELRDLNYRVDLRSRKRLEEMTHTHWIPAYSSSSDESPYRKSQNRARQHATAEVRYVEDLVDETLQTRIGESVMEHFEEPGTLVLATGDAKPAKYSDGFYTYALRALKMGWHVEVVSWKLSLSSTWRSKEWGERLRVIELDDYLDDLVA